MTTWIESSNTKQDGTPVTRRIKIPEMDEDIWFTTNAFAEVGDDVADILANNIDTLSKVSEPAEPGEYYGDAGDNTTIQINISDGVFDAVTAESGSFDSVDTEEQSISREFNGPVLKVAVLGDCHWRQSDRGGRSFVSKADLKANLDTFIDGVNAWGADLVIQIGDLADGTDTYSNLKQSLNEAIDYLENTGGSDGTGLDMPIEYHPGNHEYAFIDSGDVQEIFDIFGWDDLEGVHRIVRKKGVSIPFLDTSWRTVDMADDQNAHEIPDADDPFNALQWLENTVAEETNPLVPITHVPIPPGEGQAYDETVNEGTAAAHFAEMGEYAVGIFGHSHHQKAWDVIREQPDKRGNRWLHVCTPNALMDNMDVVPWGKLMIDGTGTWRMEAAYQGTETDYQTAWGGHLGNKSGATAGQQSFATGEQSRTFSWPPTDALQVFGSGSVNESVSDGHIVLDTGATSGDNVDVIRRVDSTLQLGSVTSGWEDPVRGFRTKIEFNSNTNQSAHVVWGGSGEDYHFGFEINDEVISASCADGDGKNTEDFGYSVGDNGDYLEFIATMVPGDRVDCYIRNRYGATKYLGFPLTENVPGGSAGARAGRVASMGIETNEDASKTMTVSEWEYWTSRNGFVDMVQ